MIDTSLHCPHPKPLETSSDVLAELTSLLDHLGSDQSVSQSITFPRGTVLPDGRLDLCKQGLGVTGCRLVTEALKTNTAIASLLLGTNGIGDPGAKEVAQLIQHNDRLEVVYLGCNAISEIGVASLAKALTHNQSVTGLWLKRNPKGLRLFRSIEDFMRRIYQAHEFSEVRSPIALSRSLWERSKHWEPSGINLRVFQTEALETIALFALIS